MSAGDRPAAERKSRAPGSDGRQAQAAGDDRIVRTGGVRVRLSAGCTAFFFASGGRFSRNLLLILSGGRPWGRFRMRHRLFGESCFSAGRRAVRGAVHHTRRVPFLKNNYDEVADADPRIFPNPLSACRLPAGRFVVSVSEGATFHNL